MGGDLKKSEVALSSVGGPQNGVISPQMQLADPQEISESTRSDEMRLKPVEEQVVALMGASSGIGRETALRFAERGARVVVSARSEEGPNSLVEEVRDKGGQATAIPAEVTDFEQVKAVANAAVEKYGRLDTWVHLAAVGLFATFEQTTPEEFARVIDVNLMGQVYGAMAALPHLKREGRGALIHISSVEAKRSFPFHSAYGASKHGIDGFLEALRVELKHEGWPISVTQVMPATINTPFFDKGRTKLGVKPVGIPPIYEPETVANVILYAAENPARDLVSGGAAQALIIYQRLSPRMLDTVLATRAGFSPQLTDEPRSKDDPDNLYAPIEGHDTARNDFRALSRSLYNWLEMHPTVRRGAAVGTALELLGALRKRL
jgi:NAD(P)-dependent dehydrogenase (short-subunit alcohol dehydrogenase family)